jgi:5-methylcytosine-specific restriction endonuclease McrA
MKKFETEEIVSAYLRTGSVWKAGKLLGMAGQSVHERLRAIGHPLNNRSWEIDEIAELKLLSGNMAISEVASRLGRTYAGIACKMSEIGLEGVKKHIAKPKRDANFTKPITKNHIKIIDKNNLSIREHSIQSGIGIEVFIQAVERHFPEWWHSYKEKNSQVEMRKCVYCDKDYIPMTKKTKYCSRVCGGRSRTDISYFGGKRRNTIGLKEATCQLCGKQGVKGLSSHHMIGKENDLDNNYLVALCMGCHKIVTFLASRTFVLKPEVWEALIQLCVLRSQGRDSAVAGVYCYVELELHNPQQIEELES